MSMESSGGGHGLSNANEELVMLGVVGLKTGEPASLVHKSCAFSACP
jgi:hypothetical protein